MLLTGSLCLFSFILGIFCYRLYQSRLIRFLPEQNKCKIKAFFNENIDHGHHTMARPTLIIRIENLDDKPLHLESWFLRTLTPQGFLRQFFYHPQNLVHTMAAKETYSIEVQDINFLKEQTLYTIVIRDIFGREWTIEPDEIHHLRKDLFWQSIP